MLSGASVCPMKILAATFSDSAPLMRMVTCINRAMALITICMMPRWYSTAKKAEIKIMVGKTWKAKMIPKEECCLPRSPKTNPEPTKA
jgi:hypothetical protein